MPKFSQESFSKLSSCQIELQILFFEVVRCFDCKVTEGYRCEEDQNEAFERGATKLKWPDGKHNKHPSMAVDVYPCPVSLSSNPKNISRFYLFAGYVLGIAERLKQEGKMTHSVRWGGDWNGDKDLTDQIFDDLSHFEILA